MYTFTITTSNISFSSHLPYNSRKEAMLTAIRAAKYNNYKRFVIKTKLS